MGYLDGDTITVDAVLTKKGRQMISEGKQLNVTAFTLSDTGVDYTLWNADHPSGSAYYGEAIENLPMVEASVHSQYALRNKLITLNKDTISMPVLELNPDPTTQYVFDTRTPKDFTATVVGFSGGGTAGCQLLVQDKNIVTANGTQVDVTGNALSFIYEQNIPQAALYELGGGGPNYTFKITPQTIRDTSNATTNLTFIHTTGAYATIEVKVNFNKDTRQLIQSTSTIG